MQKSGFISKAACRGYRPRRLTTYNVRQRNRLITRLARDRLVARFVVAPSGYGKTSLAIDYAETMFSWTHVFWLNAKSPCFIRDLDDGDIARECIAADPDLKLVVIEDVPQLDAPRIQRFSSEIDALLARECEVLVTCAPSCDLAGGLQLDRLRLGAGDLLLDDDEADAMRGDEERIRLPVSRIPASHRVPGLMWAQGPEAHERFVADAIGEDVPADLLLVTATVLALHEGSLEDVRRVGPIGNAVTAEVLADYPHLGFDFEEGAFEAPLLDAEMVAHALKGGLDALVERSAFSTRAELVRAWADAALPAHRAPERACDVVRVLCPVKERARWLVEHGRALVQAGCFYPVVRFMGGLRKGQFDDRDRVRALEALCCMLLGDDDNALKLAKRLAFDASAHDDARALGMIMTVRLGKGVLRDNALASMREWNASIGAREGGGLAWHEALVFAWVMREDGIESAAKAWRALRDCGSGDDVLCIAASWLYALVEGDGEKPVPLDIAVEPVEQYVRSQLAVEEVGSIGFLAASAGLSMEQAHMRGAAYFRGPLPARTLLELRHVELSMLRQRREYERGLRREQAVQARWSAEALSESRPNSGPADAGAAHIPLLEVKTFCRFDVIMGGAPLEPSRLKRRQTRELLVVLAANWGRDLSIDSIAHATWPRSSPDTARKNFYTTWSQLRRSLTLPDGTCPYLVRTRYGCRLNDRHVRSDLARLGDICRELLMGRVDFDGWVELYNEIDRDFSGDLLPVESGNQLIAKARKDYSERLVDALATASMRLVDAGNPQLGIWFARAALSHGPTREDVYVALMRAQIAHGQRTAAMMTFLNCRRTLNDELGIDPSPETQSLYDDLLDG